MNTEYTGKMITELRKEKGLTQKDVAETLHVSIAAVSKWERGLNYPELSLLEPLSALLDTTVPALLGLEDAPAERIIQDVTILSEQEKAAITGSLWKRLLLVLFLGNIILLASFLLGLLGRGSELSRSYVLTFMPLFFGFASWAFAGAGIISGRRSDSERWKIYSVTSLLSCCIALYFPYYILDSYARTEDVSALLDTVWGFHFAAIALLLGTILLNACAWIINRKGSSFF